MNPLMRITEQQRYSQSRLARRLQRKTARAITDYNMISDQDRVMVCLSGGKDSYTLLDMLLEVQKRAPIRFELIAVNLDQKQPGFPEHILPGYLDQLGVPFHVIEQDTYSVVKRVVPEGKTTCGLCSRLRRGALYNFAGKHGITRIALGHHRDDIIETLFLNLFNGGRIKAMPPKLLSDNSKHIVIRPLAYCAEEDIASYAQARQFPIIPCDLCGSQPNLQRQQIKLMLAKWKQKHPGRIENIARAISHVSPSQLADHDLFDFINLGKESKKPAQPSGWMMPPNGIQLDSTIPSRRKNNG
jgi:tRNA 2-thiocytidine biosynthesis protein TtcA